MKEKHTPSNEEGNLFRPMAAANTNPANHQQRSNVPFLMAILGLCLVASVIIQVLRDQNSLILAIVSVLPGALIALAVILIPGGNNLGWREKYWFGCRIILLIIALMFIVPIELTGSFFRFVIVLAALPLAIAYFIERLRRRYRR